MKTLIVLEYVNYKFNIIKIIFNKFFFFKIQKRFYCSFFKFLVLLFFNFLFKTNILLSKRGKGK